MIQVGGRPQMTLVTSVKQAGGPGRDKLKLDVIGERFGKIVQVASVSGDHDGLSFEGGLVCAQSPAFRPSKGHVAVSTVM